MGAEACRVEALDKDVTLSVRVGGEWAGATADDAGAARLVAEIWSRECAARPRSFDGEILHAASWDLISGRIDAQLARYRWLVASSELASAQRVRMLAVSGLITGIDRDGDECVLMGKRSMETRVYGGMWELAPSGGMSVPRGNGGADDGQSAELVETDFCKGLAAEGLEELGLEMDVGKARAVALLIDDHAASLDVVMHLRVPGVLERGWSMCSVRDESGGGTAWEYVDAAWVPMSRVLGWLDGAGRHAVIPPSAAMLRWWLSRREMGDARER